MLLSSIMTGNRDDVRNVTSAKAAEHHWLFLTPVRGVLNTQTKPAQQVRSTQRHVIIFLPTPLHLSVWDVTSKLYSQTSDRLNVQSLITAVFYPRYSQHCLYQFWNLLSFRFDDQSRFFHVLFVLFCSLVALNLTILKPPLECFSWKLTHRAENLRKLCSSLSKTPCRLFETMWTLPCRSTHRFAARKPKKNTRTLREKKNKTDRNVNFVTYVETKNRGSLLQSRLGSWTPIVSSRSTQRPFIKSIQ